MVSCKMSSAFLALSVLVFALVHTSLAQNYHFSNGWYPGRKRSSSSDGIHGVSSSSSSSRRGASSYGFFDESCSMRASTIMLINRMLQDEAARIQRSCISDIPYGLNDILENAASKLEPDS